MTDAFIPGIFIIMALMFGTLVVISGILGQIRDRMGGPKS